MKSMLSLSDIQRRQLFEGAAQRVGIQEIILEKDFWVCWTLRELFALSGIGEHLIFKGGTSLSKAWGAIARFSEDIDVSLSREWLGFGGERDPEKAGSNKKTETALENLTNACIAKIASHILPALKASAERHLGNDGWTISVDAGDPQTLRFKYPSSFGQSAAQLAYVPREVKIEFGARSDDWPAGMRPIRPYVAEAFPDRITDAGVVVRTLSIARTFWEKATILHAEAHRASAGKSPRARYSRHYADLAVLADHECAAEALADIALLNRVVTHKKIFFRSGSAKYEEARPGSFRLVPTQNYLNLLEKDYKDMREMFFGEPLSWDRIISRLRKLESQINNA